MLRCCDYYIGEPGRLNRMRYSRQRLAEQRDIQESTAVGYSKHVIQTFLTSSSWFSLGPVSLYPKAMHFAHNIW
jgi:hypothetical protein